MGDLSAAGEKDPYMQAYITARMKNQVEEMKLQKMLSTMEVSQKVNKIMINLELFEDRKTAHKLQQEVVKVSRRQRKVTNSFLQQKADRHQRTANWTSSMMTSSSDHTHNLANALGSHQPTGERVIYPVTKVKDFNTPSAWGTRDSLPYINPNSRGPSGRVPSRQHKPPVTLPEPHSTTPMIQITDCNGDGVTVVAPEPVKSAEGKDTTSTKAVPKWAYDSTAKAGASWIVPPPTKTTVIITPPPLTGSHRGSHPTQRRPATEPYRRSAEGSVCFPPVVRARSTRTRYTRSTHTASTHKRLANASRMWPGDPRAICSVRRDRKNVDEMLATKKAGEETRRLIRESVAPCSRNCNKPNIISLMERTYVNLPDLLPEIEKARNRMYGDGGETTPRQDKRSSAEKKRQVGRFELEAEQVEGSKELPIYKIDYNKLREMGGTRRNSVLA